MDEFVTFVNNNVPQGTYGLKSVFRTIGKRKIYNQFLKIIYLILLKIKIPMVMVLLKKMNLNNQRPIIKI